MSATSITALRAHACTSAAWTASISLRIWVFATVIAFSICAVAWSSVSAPPKNF
jgi:hypothetical protein